VSLEYQVPGTFFHSRTMSQSFSGGADCPTYLFSVYSTGPAIVQVKSLDTDSALNSAGPALLRAIPL